MSVERATLAGGYSISRLLMGGWQLAGGHGSVSPAAAHAQMQAYADAGITTFDCADIYTGVEELIGSFKRLRATPAIQVHTKCVPDRQALATLRRADIERLIDRSLMRLGVEQLDLVQFHWWDYALPGCATAAQWLAELSHAGKIRHVGITNFDTPQLAALLAAGVPVATHQLQYSVLDRRAENGMVALCAAHGVQLLCYGALAGGFLSEKYLGQPAPIEPLENRSLVKYRLIIEEFGGWDKFQSMLQALQLIAAKHHATIGAVALRYVLDQPQVAGVIAGARNTQHLPATLAAMRISLDAADRTAIAAVQATASGPGGDTYTLERNHSGPHAGIMRYNINAAN
jgi:aryl-alcohol dehydrogenase-like predicted oxidoreductase